MAKNWNNWQLLGTDGYPISAGNGWQVDTTGTLSTYLREFWNMQNAGDNTSGGSFDHGVLKNWHLEMGSISGHRWAMIHPRGGRRGSVDIAGNTGNWPRTTGVRSDFLPLGTKPFWISAWFYPRAINDLIVTCSGGGGNRHFYSGIDSDSKAYFRVSTDGTNWVDSFPKSVGTVTLNAWNHVLIGWANGNQFVSLNGETRVDSASASVYGAGTTQPVEFGNWVNAPSGNALDGHLADIALWCDTATSPTMVEPTAQQIADLRNNGSGNAYLGVESFVVNSVPVIDSISLVQDPADATKQVRIDAGTVATGNTRVITMANQDVSLVPGSTYSKAVNPDFGVDSNTVIRWKLDETSSPAVNSGSGGTLDLTRNAGTWSPRELWGGRIGHMLNTGTQRLVTVDTVIGQLSTFTHSCWIRLMRTKASAHTFGKNYNHGQSI